MRLLHTTTLALHEFSGDGIPPYAILSHRWETEEVTFQDFQAGQGPRLKGYSKILGCCAQAALDGWEYAWVDSCCIDKTSSGELSEAINSMFQWYQKSQVCFVYLSDVHAGQQWSDQEMPGSEFQMSKWWTRGWTLQELLAPWNVIFFDQDWKELGTKLCFAELISSISGIALRHLNHYGEASVAQKMSWASRRETSRVEDQAYSLMGLFDVHMPPLYGEGKKAFQRLQHEILATSDDESLFAWALEDPLDRPRGLLADSSVAFIKSGNIVRSTFDSYRPPFAMTNKGLRMELYLVPTGTEFRFLAPLNCAIQNAQGFVALVLYRNVLTPSEKNQFHRRNLLEHVHGSQFGQRSDARTLLFVKQYKRYFLQLFQLRDDEPSYTHYHSVSFKLTTTSLLQHGFKILQESFSDRNLHEKNNLWKISEYGEEDEKRRIVFGKCSRVWLKFTKESLMEPTQLLNEKDSFVILLDRGDELPPPGASLRLFTTSEKLTLEVEREFLLRSIEKQPHVSDRSSKLLRSGSSVSATIRRRVERGQPVWVLDVMVDEKGLLPWPAPKE